MNSIIRKERDILLFSLLSGLFLYLSNILSSSHQIFDPILAAIVIGPMIHRLSFVRYRLYFLIPFAILILLTNLFLTDLEYYAQFHLSLIIILIPLVHFKKDHQLNFKPTILSTIDCIENCAIYVTSVFITFLIWALFYSLAHALDAFFKINSPYINSAPLLLVPFVYISVKFMIEENEFFGHERLMSILTRLLKNIISPVFILYSVILFLYQVSLLLKQEIPRGYVSWPSVIAILCWTLGSSLQEAEFNRGWKKWLLLPAITLFTFGVFVRVRDYGLTPDRIYLILSLCITIIVYCVYLLRKKFDSLLSVSILLFSLLFSLIPYFQFTAISSRSQLNRLESLLKNITKEQIKNLNYTQRSDIQGILYFLDKDKYEDKIIAVFERIYPDLNSHQIKTLKEDLQNERRLEMTPDKDCISFKNFKGINTTSSFKNFVPFHSHENITSFNNQDLKIFINSNQSSFNIDLKNKTLTTIKLKDYLNNKFPEIIRINNKNEALDFELVLTEYRICSHNGNYFNGYLFYDER